MRLAVRITDTGGGIGSRLEWRVKSQSNPQGQTQGRVQPDELKGLTEPSGRAVTVTETLKVDPSHPNTIEVTAYNGQELIATPPLAITVDAFGATTEERPRMYVLAIGVDKYRMKDYELHYAAEDAASFAKAMETLEVSFLPRSFPRS